MLRRCHPNRLTTRLNACMPSSRKSQEKPWNLSLNLAWDFCHDPPKSRTKRRANPSPQHGNRPSHPARRKALPAGRGIRFNKAVHHHDRPQSRDCCLFEAGEEVVSRGGARPGAGRPKVNVDERRVRVLAADGITQRAIAARMQVSRDVVRRVLRTHSTLARAHLSAS